MARDLRDNFSKLVTVPEGDPHYLSKAVEACCNLDMLEIMFISYSMRKESRGFHIRADYPERDDKHYLRWIVVDKGEDGPVLSWERIPFERYPIWYSDSPRLMWTFVEAHADDLAGARVIPFCTSMSVGVGESARHLASLAPLADWAEGTRFEPGASDADVAAWADSMQ